MDVVLKVIEGAKEGGELKIKKEKFLIGRSPKCHLCAGSTAISRQHCAIKRNDSRVSIKDYGSRNGTLVNGKKIKKETELFSGDEITIGPLKFLITITHGINNTKKSEVKSVAEAVERTVAKGDSGSAGDDITDWLLEPVAPLPQSVSETQTIEMDDTNALQMLRQGAEEAGDDEGSSILEGAESEETSEDDSKKGKKKPGKLPPIAREPATKDSREAASEALRNWNRRR